MQINYHTITSKGTYHSENQDSYHIVEHEELYLFCIADGIGGLSQGDLASKIAIESIINQFSPNIELSSLISRVNMDIIQESMKLNSIMGSTLTIARIHKKKYEITIASIGDTRAYLFNDAIWKTCDHTLVQELVDMNIISETQAFQHPLKHRLNNALGIYQKVTYDIYKKEENYDFLLLCSDGLHDYILDVEMKDIIYSNDLKNACTKLENLARTRGSTDDITILLIRIS